MPRPYSEDLRLKVINTYFPGEGFLPEIAARFKVSLTFVRNLLRHYRQTGSVKPKKRGGLAPK
ncbi:MAG: hypothetical protein F6K18_10875 [Okeania sp. SIO2C2]|uniref:hypothetical protein n=1 Tax=Okeania sp. SIO2C2 TaxID=2607787 RepID=UPI0013BAC23F|nr:hypothetical protein [Okeania sp. SIO2C2]NEP87289.1 hypothetical protein [Okeania sp. SIO2C2]